MINRVTLRGYVADEPFVRATEGGKLARIRIATVEHLERVSRVGDATTTRYEHIEWHTVTLWGKLADIVDEGVMIGTPIYIEGKLRTREWEDRKGVKNRVAEIAAERLDVLSGIAEHKLPKQIIDKMEFWQIERLGCKRSGLTLDEMEVLRVAKRGRKSGTTKIVEINAPSEDPDGLPF